MKKVIDELHGWIERDMLLFILFDEVWRDVKKLSLEDYLKNFDAWKVELSSNTLLSVKMVCCPSIAPSTPIGVRQIYWTAITKLCHFLLSCGDEEIANRSVQIFSEGAKILALFESNLEPLG